jgi:hypothetical protein
VRRTTIPDETRPGIEGPMTSDEVNDLIRSLFPVETPPLVGGLESPRGGIPREAD